MTSNLSRRSFITTTLTAAGGFALGIGIGESAEAATLSVRPWGDEARNFLRVLDWTSLLTQWLAPLGVSASVVVGTILFVAGWRAESGSTGGVLFMAPEKLPR